NLVKSTANDEDIGIQEKKAKLFNEWEVPVNETFHIQTDDELTEKELKQIEGDDQAIQTILLSLPEDIYAAVDSCEIAQEIWLRVQQMMKGSDIGIQEKKAKLFNEWVAPHQDQPSFNQNYMQQPMSNLEYITDPTTAMNMMVGGNGENQFRQYAGQNVGNLNGGVGHFARNYMVKPRRRDAAYLPTQLLIAQKEEAGIQLHAEEFDLMAAAADLDKIEEVNANCILMANLQQASTSGTQTDKALVYDSNESAEVHDYENCNDNEIFNMFTREEQYTELLEPIPEPHQVPQNNNAIISEEAAKFVGDFKSLAKEADESLAKHKALELEIKRLLRAVKLENENVELEFQVLNYARENAHLKTTYKNPFDSISVSHTQTKTIIASLQHELQNTIFENAKLKA
nr:hypothetical protein [Tanacetum cinerariifolium]